MSADEKTPPVGGVVDYRLLGQRHRVLGRLLAAREALQAAEFIAYNSRLTGVGDVVGVFVARDFDRLVREALSLLEAGVASPVPPADGGGSQWAKLPEQSPPD